jgi:hypothetical protein
VLSPKKVAKNG